MFLCFPLTDWGWAVQLQEAVTVTIGWDKCGGTARLVQKLAHPEAGI